MFYVHNFFYYYLFIKLISSGMVKYCHSKNVWLCSYLKAYTTHTVSTTGYKTGYTNVPLVFLNKESMKGDA